MTPLPPPFVVVPFREVRLLAVDGILRIIILRSVLSRSSFVCLVLCEFLASSRQVLCWFLARHFVTCNFDDLRICIPRIGKKSIRIPSKAWKLSFNRYQNQRNWCPMVPRSASEGILEKKRFQRQPGRWFLKPFGRKSRSKGRFLDPRKIENRSKTALLRIDGHFGRPKMWKRKGSGDTLKFHEKFIGKMVPRQKENH